MKRISVAIFVLCGMALISACSGGGGGGSSDAPTNFSVSTSAGSNGSINPSSRTVESNGTTTFEITPNTGHTIDSVTGCNGTLADDGLFTTGPITGTCTVTASFRRPFISGTISPAGATAVDSSVNDPNDNFAANDSAASAQEILNPVTVGGYVNQPEEGPEGRSFESGNQFDVFRVNLIESQFIVLFITSPNTTDDLDLFLVDSNQQLVADSVDPVSRIEFVSVPDGASGQYFVVVEAFSGSSNYLLLVGEPFANVASTMRSSDPFIPGEAIVKLKDKAISKNRSLANLATASGWKSSGIREPAPRNMLFDLDDLRQAAPDEWTVRKARQAGTQHDNMLDRLGVTYAAFDRKLDTLYMIKALQSDPTVAEAAPNYIHTFEQVTPNDPRYPLQWHYPQISLPNAWALSTGNDTIVAVVDSGVLLDHPDLQGQLVPGYDFVNNQPGGNDPGQQPPPVGGSSFHGTHVAGTIAAATNNQLQVAGTAFDARVMPLRVCSVFCSSFATEQAVRYAAGLPNDSGTVPAQPAHVINLSLGRGGPPLSSEQALYDEVRAANIAVVAAAGNDNTSNEFFPAAYNGVIAVSAVDIQRRKAPYSNFGPWIDVAAPGGDLTRDLNADGHPDGVLSTLGDDRSTELQFTTKFLQGTSMAAPHVAGVLALMRAANPGLTTDDITTLLVNGDMTDDLGQPGRDDTFGHGLINANKAVTAAIEAEGDSVDLEPLLTASPARLNFGATRELLNVTLSNAGGGTITVEQPSEDSGGWLEVALTPTDGTLIAELTVERELLAEGPHMATVTFPSTANTVDVRVFIYVADVLDHGVGLQYVLLLDADTFEEVRTTVGRPREDSKFDFKIDDVEPGTYLLLSGSDADNNIFVCELGESCGLYRSIGDPVLIEVDGDDIENLDFVSGYDFSLGSSSTSLPLDKRGVRRDSTKKLKMSP